MAKIIYILLLLSFSFADIDVHEGESIQDAIDAAASGETIIVHDGTYTENLLIEKDLILRSENGADVTIIDGSGETHGSNMGSTIIIRPESQNPHKPIVEINGFGITNGKGSNIINKTISSPDGIYPIERVGGGMLVYVNTPKVNDCQFLENGDNMIDKGGAVFAASDTEDCDWSTRDDYIDAEDLTPAEGSLDFSDNTFIGNIANQGYSIYIVGHEYEAVSMVNNRLDVFSTEYNSASEYWVQSDYSIDYNNATGDLEAILTDVWVNPNTGIDVGNIIGDSLNPFLTINYAQSMIFPTEESPITIHLTSGIFSPSNNNEIFPINIISDITLIGEGPEITTLDAEQTGRVITLNDVYNVNISRLKITGGFADGNYHADALGGGVYARRAIATLNRVAIVGNKAWSQGKGFYAKMAELDMYNVTVAGNVASEVGNCPYCWYYSSMEVVNTIIWQDELFDFNDQYIFIDFYYSNIQGGYEGDGNMNVDPLFMDPENGNYTLQEGSACIDAGILNNIPFYCGDTPDMGAFEFFTEDCVDECDGYIMDECGVCNGDGLSCMDCCNVINGNNSTCDAHGNVNGGGLDITDIVAIVEVILEMNTIEECQYYHADVNMDESVNVMDVLILIDWILYDTTPYAYDVDGNVYNIINIGSQSWMKEDLRVTHYKNGDEIPGNHTGIEWVELTSGAYSVYNNNPLNAIMYGNLYNYYAVDDERGLCPEGWHVPSDSDWNTLVIYLDPNASIDAVGLQSDIAGGMLKETGTLEDGDGYWHAPNEGATNETLFSARGGGFRNGTSSGHYLYMGLSNYYWTSTEFSNNDVWYRRLSSGSAGFLRVYWDGGSGYSVRCIRD